MKRSAVIHRAGEARTVTMKGYPLAFLVTGDATRHTSMFEWVMAPGFETGLHVHKVQEETFYVLDGECVWIVDGERIVAPKGSYLFLPPGTPHDITNPGPRPATVLMTVSPPGHEGYFEELSSMLASGSPPDSTRIGDLRARYDTEQLSALSVGPDAHP